VRNILVLLLLVAASQLKAGQALSVAAASDLVYCLEELNASFKKAHPEVELQASTGASGNFFAQIKNGAPFDVFLSADVSYPKELIKAGLAEEESLQLYAIGHLVIWTTTDGVDVSNGVTSLTQPSIHKVAIANPDHAPYGRAAKSAVEHAKLWEAVKDKIVYGENIAQTAQFVETGNAQAGLVALSFVLSPKLAGKGKWAEIPETSYPRLEQAAVLTTRGATNPAAVLYLKFLRSTEARRVFDRYGFRLP
jgi:molybdate transport system substrate-binding protein